MPKKRVKKYTYKLNTIKPGFKVVDADNMPHTVKKVFYKQEHEGSGLESPVALILKNEKSKKQKKMSLSYFYNNYKVFNVRNLNAEASRVGSIGIQTLGSGPVVKENDSYLNHLFNDGENARKSPLTPIIEAIKKQIKEESRVKKETDVTLIFDAIHQHFNGFIARNGRFADSVADLIIFIDWLGLPMKFKDYKKEVFEADTTHNVVVINTKSKIKTFFIRVLKRIIVKYPKYKPNGGK